MTNPRTDSLGPAHAGVDARNSQNLTDGRQTPTPYTTTTDGQLGGDVMRAGENMARPCRLDNPANWRISTRRI